MTIPKHAPHVMRDLTNKVQADVAAAVKRTSDLCPHMNNHVEIVQAAYVTVLREMTCCMAIMGCSQKDCLEAMTDILIYCIKLTYEQRTDWLKNLPPELQEVVKAMMAE